MLTKALFALVVILSSTNASQEKSGSALSDAIDATLANQKVGPILDDAEFLKRLARDLTGTDPANAELQEFVASKDPNKRELRIRQLVDSPKFAEFWARRFANVFFEGRETLTVEVTPELASEIRTPLVKNIVAWLQGEIAKDRPYTEIVSDMLDARGQASGNPPVAYKLALRRGAEPAVTFAIGMSRQLLGIRLHCARCHDHPYDQWTVENLYSLAAFEVRGRARGVGARGDNAYDDVSLKYADEGEMAIPNEENGKNKTANVKVAGGGTAKPVFPFGGEARPNDDRMKVLASLVAGKGSHRQVAKALVNRIWAWLLGRGIVHPVDDFNKRTLAEARTVLLEKLANGLIDNKFSIKFLIRTICSTKLYQRADVAPPDGSTEVYWHGALVRNVMPKPPPLPKDLISFEVPGAWAGVNRSSGGKAQFAVPDKDRKARDAELAVFQISGAAAVKTQIERWGRQMADLKSTSQAVDGGKGKITLHVHSGTYTCDRTSDGPSDDRMLVGIVETGGETWAFRFVGSAPVVDGWRDEFLTLLKGARK